MRHSLVVDLVNDGYMHRRAMLTFVVSAVQ